MNPCTNKTDSLIFVCCICPLSSLAYACSYYMLKHIHPDTTGYAMFVAYGLIQFLLGSISGYCVFKWANARAHNPINTVEEIPLLVISSDAINHSASDTEEALEA